MRNKPSFFFVRRFPQKTEGSTAGRLPMFYEKTKNDANVVFNRAQRNAAKTANEQISIEQNDLLKATMRV